MRIIKGFALALVLSFLVVFSSAQQCESGEIPLENCTTVYSELCVNYNTLLEEYNSLAGESGEGSEEDPCASSPVADYDRDLHIAAVFIILAASLVGSAAPLLSKYGSRFKISPYHVCLGKCIGIGIVLACALIHMLLPSNESLTSPCVPAAFNEEYPAYAYLFAMLAGLLMHFVDFVVHSYMVEYQTKNGPKDQESLAHTQRPGHGHDHAHLVILDPKLQRTISAYLLEFSVTVHSIFIGLTVGVSDNETLKALVVALVFHQFFEGVALGSRIADASLKSHWSEFILSFVFSVSAPIGIVIGIAVVTTLDTNGESFLLIQGIFDGICAGILLYIGFMLLLKDFPEDMEIHCKGPKSTAMKGGMFFCLWLGAGMMAFIGRYL